MDGQHLVEFRFTLKSVPRLRLTFGDHVRVLRNVEGTFIARLGPPGCITLSGMEGNGSLPISDCEALWDDLMIEVELRACDGWEMIQSWEEINAAQIQMPKAAE